MKISIVIPAYNEQDNIAAVVEECDKSFPEAEIIVVNDGSTDNIAAILTELQSRFANLKVLENEQNLGHARTLLKGLKAAQSEYVLYIDADRQIKPNIAKAFIGRADLISGYRIHRQDKAFRKVVSFILKIAILIKHQQYILDANCPFKIFRKETLDFLLPLLPKNSIVPSIDLEVLARKQKMVTIQVPVWHYPLDHPRKGFLQSLNFKSLKMFKDAFMEVMSL